MSKPGNHRKRRILSELQESVRMALGAVASHKLRSGLTLLGVLVGVFSIILVMTAMRAMKNNVEKEFGQLGSKTFVMQRVPSVFFDGPAGFLKFLRRKPLTIEHAKQFKAKQRIDGIVGFHTSFNSGEASSQYGKTPPNVSVEGTSPEAFQSLNWSIVDGRLFSSAELEAGRDVCVISTVVAEALFPFGSPVGQRIKVASVNYTVVGVFEQATSGEESRGVAAIPITTGLNRYGRRRDLAIVVQVDDPAIFEDAKEEARGVLRAVRKVSPGNEDDFEILTSDAMIAQFRQVTFAVRTGLAFVSSIALIAAGVGIMNIMLVSVTERTREIGVRRAVGARKSNILIQFLIEAVVLCEIGGMLGIILGMAGANALAIYLLKLPPAFPVDWAIIGLVICSVVGIVFGSYPAYKAANLDPIESLRYE
jgi:putative ABC transport system permease protein